MNRVSTGDTVMGEGASLQRAVNPLQVLKAAKQLLKLYTALTEAAETAGFCSELCEDMAATACNRAPICASC